MRRALLCTALSVAKCEVFDASVFVQRGAHVQNVDGKFDMPPSEFEVYTKKRVMKREEELEAEERNIELAREETSERQRKLQEAAIERERARILSFSKQSQSHSFEQNIMATTRAEEEAAAKARHEERLKDLEMEEERIAEMRKLADEQYHTEELEIAARGDERNMKQTHNALQNSIMRDGVQLATIAEKGVSSKLVTRRGGATVDELKKLPEQLKSGLKNALFVAHVKSGRKEVQESMTIYTESFQEKLHKFQKTINSTEQPPLGRSLKTLFLDSWELLREHQADVNAYTTKVRQFVPPNLTKTVGPLLDMISLNIVPMEFPTDALERSEYTDLTLVCHQLSKVLGDYDSKVRLAVERLNATAHGVPPLLKMVKTAPFQSAGHKTEESLSQQWYTSYEMDTFLRDTVNVAFAEGAALERASKSMLDVVGNLTADGNVCGAPPQQESGATGRSSTVIGLAMTILCFLLVPDLF